VSEVLLVENMVERKFGQTEVLRKASFWATIVASLSLFLAVWSVSTGQSQLAAGFVAGAVAAFLGRTMLVQLRQGVTNSMKSDWSQLYQGAEVELESGAVATIVATNEFATRFEVKFEDGFHAWHHGGHLKREDGTVLATYWPGYVSPDEGLKNTVLPLRWRLPDGRIGTVRDAQRRLHPDGSIDDHLWLKVGADPVREFRRTELSAFVEGASYPPPVPAMKPVIA
jgi:hypothetical protein